MVKFSCFARIAVLMMLIVGVSINGRAQSFDADGFSYRIISVQKNEAMIYGLTPGVEAPSALVIPSTASFNGRTFNIISMADSAFMNLPIESVTLPDSLKSISNYAFADCENLTGIINLKQITAIGDGAFRNCRGIKQVDARSGKIATIGRDAFLNCESLADFLTSSTVKKVGVSAFKNCMALREFAFSQQMYTNVEVGDSAFYNTRSLKRIITNPDLDNRWNYIEVGASAFESSGLSGELSFRAGLIKKKSFANTGISSIDIKMTDSSVLDSAFAYCENIETVKIADSWIVGKGAFYGCNKLKFLSASYVLWYRGDYETGGYEFANLPALEEAILTNVYVQYDYGHGEIYDNKITKGMFMNCPSLRKVTIGSLYSVVGPSAFEGCTSLVEVKKDGGGWSDFLQRAFYGCTSLKKFQWGTDYLGIYEEAFANSGIHSVLTTDGLYIENTNAFTPLDTIYADNSTPVRGNFDFTDDEYLNIVVVVPPGSLAAYQATSPWDKFWHLEEGKMPTDGIEAVGVDSPSTDEEMWYDLHGRRINPASAAPGLYIRRQGSTTSKILLR